MVPGMNEPGHPAASVFRDRFLHPSTRGFAQTKLKPLLSSSKAIALRNGIRIWNWSPALRTAATKHKAEATVKRLMNKIPL